MSNFTVDAAICSVIQRTPDELARMTLREFCNVAYYYGHDVRVDQACLFSDRIPNLDLEMDAADRPIIHVKMRFSDH